MVRAEQTPLSANGSPSDSSLVSSFTNNASVIDFNSALEELGVSQRLTAPQKLPKVQEFYPEYANQSNTEASVYYKVMYWYHPDYIGNVDLVTDRNGEAFELFLYNAWGENMYDWESGAASFSSPYRFNGKEEDPETGFRYYGARYHHPKLSVWLSVDPLAHRTLEAYVFTGNNPITFIDPDGNTIYPVTTGTNEKQNSKLSSYFSKWKTKRPNQFAYLNSLYFHNGTISGPGDENYNDAKAHGVEVNVEIIIADLDGKSPGMERKEEEANSNVVYSAEAGDSHLNGVTEIWTDNTGQRFDLVMCLGNGKVTVMKDGTLTSESAEVVRVDLEGYEFPYARIRWDGNGNPTITIKIDDYLNGKPGWKVIAHEGGHIEGMIMDLINTALYLYEKENIDEKEKGGHQKGEKHGDVARDREKNDRPAQ